MRIAINLIRNPPLLDGTLEPHKVCRLSRGIEVPGKAILTNVYVNVPCPLERQ